MSDPAPQLTRAGRNRKEVVNRYTLLNIRSWICRGVLVLFCPLLTAGAGAQTNLLVGYDASSEVRPNNITNSVFNLFQAGGPGGAYARATNGLLYMVQVGYFGHFPGNIDFASDTNVYVLDANVCIVRSDYTAWDGLQRSGHYFEAYDSTGNGF